MSDRGIPYSYRHMHGFSSHAYSFINKDNKRYWVKFHFKTQQGIKNLTDEEAAAILGTARGIPSSSKALKVLEDANVLSELTVTATNEGIAQAGKPQSTWQMNSEVIDTMQQVIDEFGYGRTTAREAAESMVTSLESTLSRL